MSNRERTNWLNSMTWQVNFYGRSGRVRRMDPEFEWRAFERSRSGRLVETRRFVKHVLESWSSRSSGNDDGMDARTCRLALEYARDAVG